MGRQINYYMGYNDFLTVAQTALDCGCVIYRADHADERWSITSGNSTDMISGDHRSYYFHVPQAGDIISVRGKGKMIYDSPLSSTKNGRQMVKLLKFK